MCATPSGDVTLLTSDSPHLPDALNTSLFKIALSGAEAAKLTACFAQFVQNRQLILIAPLLAQR